MTELIWEGKYDEKGKKTAPVRVALPFQTVETVNESAADRRRTLSLFAQGRDTDWRNRLIWGDKKYVLPSLLPEFAGKVNLIYIDPPFNVGADFSFTTTIPDVDDDAMVTAPFMGANMGAVTDSGDKAGAPYVREQSAAMSFVKEPSIIEQKAYRDTWGRGMDSYLQWFYETAVLLHELLADDGSIYVHLDWHIGHYAKVMLDEVLGYENFRNEIVWKRTSARSGSSKWGNIHDSILLYSKSEQIVWNIVFQDYDQKYLDSKYKYVDGRGVYRLDNLTAPGMTKGDSSKPWKSFDPAKIGRHWAVPVDVLETLSGTESTSDLTSQQKLNILYENDYIQLPQKTDGSGFPQFKRYLGRGTAIQDVITDLAPVNSQAVERLNYPTQKPEALLERIIKASSNEGDLVLDCFCGSGTTAAVAEKLNRRWIAADLGRFAIHTTRKRLLQIPELKPFVVQNLGKYERQAWLRSELRIENEELRKAEAQPAPNSQFSVFNSYIRFILDLYHARPISGYTWLHGVKGGRMVHVGAVDAPVSVGDVTNIAAEFRKMIGKGKGAPTGNGVDVLGWDFAFEMNEVARQQAAAANLQVRFVRIPRDVMDKRAVEQGDVKFFELAALDVDVKAGKGRTVTLELSNFVIPPDDVPEDVRKAVTHWEQWIDYWAVDWDNKSDTFHNEWQSYRTRKDKTLQRKVTKAYDQPGEYRVVVKVIDILGNDTTKTLKVKVE